MPPVRLWIGLSLCLLAAGGAEGTLLDDPEFLERARSYTRGNWLLYLADTAWSALLLFGLTFTGASSRAWSWIRSRAGSGPAGGLVYIAGLVTLISLMTLPLDYYDQFIREHSYGFSTQTASAWAADRVRSLTLTIVVFALFFIPLYGVIRRFPRNWWMAGAALACAGAALFAVAAPLIVEPLFNDFTPLEEGGLRTSLLDLARREGFEADEIWQMDGSSRSIHDNAYVSGMMGTGRIVLYDTLLRSYSPDEIAFILSHEVGHYVMNHVWKSLVLTWGLIIAGFWLAWMAFRLILTRCSGRTGLSDPADLATMPLLLLVVLLTLFVTLPLQSAFSRHMESQADLFALESVDHPGAAVGAFRKMAVRNLHDPDPPAVVEWFLYSHPSMGRRIRSAEEFLKTAPGGAL